MSYFEDIYKKRANRYGTDYQSRIQGQRERLFDQLLLKSLYRVDFEWNGQNIEAILERYKQDETETLQYLLTRTNINIDNGTILMIPDKDMVEQPWMIYYLEHIKASGYNRYIVLKMTHFIEWKDREENLHSTWCYLHGDGDSALRDALKVTGAVYSEDHNERFIIMPLSEYMKKDDYFEIGEGRLKEAYRVLGYDIHSTPGVEYVTIDPMYIKDTTPAPTPSEDDDLEDFYWFEGGSK